MHDRQTDPRPGTRPVTPKGAATRRRIIEGAATEIRERGVEVTTLDDVRARTHTSKSQLFHYFPQGKDELLLAVARHEAGRVLDDQQPELDGLTSWPAWLAWRDKVVARYRGRGPQCPLTALMSQLRRSTPGTQSVVSELMDQWQRRIAAGIRQMQGAGEVDAGLDADRVAGAILAAIQGGVVILMSTGRIEQLEAALDVNIAFLRAKVVVEGWAAG
ncbi:MAG TPA: TetR/AcrR family transcriptional regulator [Actinocrinis sp.]|nr:TetR/AcrR family transcriptional regulator [Actinocrinis sp.]